MPGLMLRTSVLFLVLAILLAALPRPAQAACALKYKVQSGDTLYRIAATYQVTFEDLVEANKLKAPYLIFVGQVLCIPQGAVIPEATPSSTQAVASTATAKNLPTITTLYLGDISWIALSNFPKNRFFNVKVYDGTKYYWNGPEYRIAMIATDAKGGYAAWFKIPSGVGSSSKITICIKDVINDDVLVCDEAVNPDFYQQRHGVD